MLVDNPRRALMGKDVGPGDFRPELGVTEVRWSGAQPGALEVVTNRTLTDAEQAEVRAVAQSTDDIERVVRDRAEQAMDGLRSIAGSTGTLTATQLSNAARLFARVLLMLIRLQLRRLDTADDTAPPSSGGTTAPTPVLGPQEPQTPQKRPE